MTLNSMLSAMTIPPQGPSALRAKEYAAPTPSAQSDHTRAYRRRPRFVVVPNSISPRLVPLQ